MWLHVDPRRLLLRVHASFASFTACVLHAPSPKIGQPTRVKDWWAETEKIVSSVANPAYPMVVMIDANGRVGDRESDAVGPVDAADEDEPGAELHNFALRHQLHLPATWMGGGGTWQACNNVHHRIDYVMMPNVWRDLVSRTWVDRDTQLAPGEMKDHSAAYVSWFPPKGKVEMGYTRTPKIALRQALDDDDVNTAARIMVVARSTLP